MELRQLQLFCLIKEHQSITMAAKASGLSQPTVSQHLKNLERELGASLFHRRNRRMTLTAMGELFYPYAKRICRIAQEAKTALSRQTGLVKGPLRIAASTIPGQYILPKILKGYLEVYPLVMPHVLIGDSAWGLEQVKRQEVEMAFVGMVNEDGELVFIPFFTDEVILVAPPSASWLDRKEIGLDEVPSLPLLLREPGSGTCARFLGHLKESGIDPNALRIVAHMGSTESLIEAAKRGLGAGVVSNLAVEDELSRGTLIKIKIRGAALKRTFHLTYLAKGGLSPAARALEDFVRNMAAQSNETAIIPSHR